MGFERHNVLSASVETVEAMVEELRYSEMFVSKKKIKYFYDRIVARIAFALYEESPTGIESHLVPPPFCRQSCKTAM